MDFHVGIELKKGDRQAAVIPAFKHQLNYSKNIAEFNQGFRTVDWVADSGKIRESKSNINSFKVKYVKV